MNRILGLLDFLRNTLQFKIVSEQAPAAATFKKSLREIPVSLFVLINASSLGFAAWLESNAQHRFFIEVKFYCQPIILIKGCSIFLSLSPKG